MTGLASIVCCKTWIEREYGSLIQARKFSNLFWLKDDLLAINGDREFETVYHEIYSPGLELKQESNSDQEACFLDLGIKNENQTFSKIFCDKRDFFPFSIVRMPYMCSNKSSKIFHAALEAEILRVARTTTETENFK